MNEPVITEHALERMLERLPSEMAPGLRAALGRAQAKFRRKAVAVVLGHLTPEQAHEQDLQNAPLAAAGLKVSSGDAIVAILREGKTTTVMLRRTQPCVKCLAVRNGYRCPHRQEMTPFALYVDQVVTKV